MAVGIAGIVVVAGLVYAAATTPAYACANEWAPVPTPSPLPSATERLGYVQDDLGRQHIPDGTAVKYALCPPASGKHINITGEGPIKPGVYKPDDKALPQGWIHNLEHGGLVLLYKCPGDACTDAGQAALQKIWDTWPNSPVCNLARGQVGPIIARFDQMQFPYAALLWGQVLPLDTLDADRILAFFAQQGERSNPEPWPGCVAPTPTPGPTGTPAPSASAAPSTGASPSVSAAPSASVTPTATPAPSAAPTAS